MNENETIKKLKEAEQATAEPSVTTLKAAVSQPSASGRRRVLLGYALVIVGLVGLLTPLWAAAGLTLPDLPAFEPARLLYFWWLIFLVKPLVYGVSRAGRCNAHSQ